MAPKEQFLKKKNLSGLEQSRGAHNNVTSILFFCAKIFRIVGSEIMEKVIITNNPLIKEKFASTYEVELYHKDYLGVLETVRDKIHLGHELLSHPLAGSIKPNETPYRTILISKNKKQLDMKSLTIIESAIETTKKFIANRPTPDWKDIALFDFQTVDLSLIENVLSNLI